MIMFIGKQGALLAGASPLASPPNARTARSDPHRRGQEGRRGSRQDLRGIQDQERQRLTQAEKKGEDAVTKDEVEKLNKAIDDAKAELKKQLDTLEAKANRLALGGGAAAADEAKAAKPVRRADRQVRLFGREFDRI
jgi:hypothetical protein